MSVACKNRGKGGSKLKGEFVLREIMGEMIAIPVGKAALDFNGMICLNDTGRIVFAGLRDQKTKEQILEEILESFDVSREEATADMEAFLLRMEESGLLDK